MKAPGKLDKVGLINYLHEMGQADPRYQAQQRKSIARAVKGLITHRTLNEKEFAHAMQGMTITPEILFSLTVHHNRVEVRRLYNE